MKKSVLVLLFGLTSIATPVSASEGETYKVDLYYQSGFCYMATFGVENGKNLCWRVGGSPRLQTEEERLTPKEMVEKLEEIILRASVECPIGYRWSGIQGCSKKNN